MHGLHIVTSLSRLAVPLLPGGQRGTKVILSGQYKAKDKKKTMRAQKKVGVVCPEPLPETVATPSEIKVSRLTGKPASAQVVDLGNPRLQAVGFSGG